MTLSIFCFPEMNQNLFEPVLCAHQEAFQSLFPKIPFANVFSIFKAPTPENHSYSLVETLNGTSIFDSASWRRKEF